MARTKTDVGRTDAVPDASSGGVERSRIATPQAQPVSPPSQKTVTTGPSGVFGGGTGAGGGGGGGGERGVVGGARAAGGVDIRQVLTGSTLKRIIGLPNALADVVLSRVKHPDGGSVTAVAQDRSDVYVAFQDIVSGIFGIGRLFSPGNVFWRLPKSGDSAMVLKPSEADGPGVPYVVHGDGQGANSVPDWLGANDSGISAPENFHVESTKAVIIKANVNGSTATVLINSDGSISVTAAAGKNINVNVSGGASTIFNNGVLAVARLTDPVTGQAGPYPLVNGQIAQGTNNVKA